jgi:ribonuclease P protein component
MPRQFTLGKNERIKSRKMIEQLFSDGKSFALHPYRVYYKIYAGSGIQFGVGVSSKNFKKAVDRNRIKRVTREAYRLEQKNPLQQMLKEKALQLNVFFIYTDKELPLFNTVKEKLPLILNKLSKIIHESNSPDT